MSLHATALPSLDGVAGSGAGDIATGLATQVQHDCNQNVKRRA
jgi:cytidylate kinase